MIDPYATLGIPRDASDEQVRRAYRRLAKRYHPDLHPGARSSEQMRRVNEAWEILSSPGRRARHDAEARLRRAQTAGHWARPARWSAPAASEPPRWTGTWASTTPSGAYARSRTAPYAGGDDSPGWVAVLTAIVVAFVGILALVAGILPPPLFWVALLLGARWIFSRFD
jgi:curved DNA-binding protein CbpA